jgi:hypothetical protein
MISNGGELARRKLILRLIMPANESATLLFRLLCARIGPPLLVICAVIIEPPLECYVGLS